MKINDAINRLDRIGGEHTATMEKLRIAASLFCNWLAANHEPSTNLLPGQFGFAYKIVVVKSNDDGMRYMLAPSGRVFTDTQEYVFHPFGDNRLPLLTPCNREDILRLAADIYGGKFDKIIEATPRPNW